jgi:hydrogenase expression/formation protein HypC
MCLAVPGQLLDIKGDEGIFRTGRVSFGGTVREVNLAYTPEAKVDDFVLVHVGFAISVIDENEANRIFDYLDEIGEIEEAQSAEDKKPNRTT